jgi:HAD superfamily hydrolase (TIGR01509 family)
MDTFPAILGCINDVLVEFGAVPFKPEELKPLVGTFIGDIYRNKGVDPDKARARHKVVYLERYTRASVVYPGATEALASLKSHGIKNAVVTMRIGEVARRVLDEYGLLNHIDVVLGENEVSRGKPDPEHVWAALRKLGVEPADACMVGDTEYDIRAGLAAGCLPIGVSWGYGHPENGGKAEVVNTFKELEELILNSGIKRYAVWKR